MKKQERIPALVEKFIEDLAGIQPGAISLITITMTINGAYLPKKGVTETILIDGLHKKVNEQQGNQPITYYVTCFEK
ncbi:hypothetical protein ACE38W_08615 [Chitinophaga sp. Hz27]|uniref:hypothetical protein n=1 Tax=Chitinophaga sp. Hz27 TaxID=3347169 RepID=UPI0035D86344